MVIDGKQRLVSINEFMAGNYRLRGLDIRIDLNGAYYLDLNAEDRAYFENATLRSTVIRNWSDENFLYIIFYRLNSGSLPLSPQITKILELHRHGYSPSFVGRIKVAATYASKTTFSRIRLLNKTRMNAVENETQSRAD